MNEETLYKKWLESRAGIEPQADMTEKIMARIESLQPKPTEAPPYDSIQVRVFESRLVRAGLALGLSLLGLIRVVYVSRLILIP